MRVALAAAWLLAGAGVRADAPPAAGSTPFTAAAAAPVELPPALTASPFSESVTRRFETVFFIALPFTAIYGSLLVGAAGLAIEGRGFRLRGPYIAAGIVLPVFGAGWIAWRDHRRPPEAAALQSNLSPR